MTFEIKKNKRKQETPFPIRIDEELMCWVSKLAKEKKQSKNKVIQRCIAFAMKHQAS